MLHYHVSLAMFGSRNRVKGKPALAGEDFMVNMVQVRAYRGMGALRPWQGQQGMLSQRLDCSIMHLR